MRKFSALLALIALTGCTVSMPETPSPSNGFAPTPAPTEIAIASATPTAPPTPQPDPKTAQPLAGRTIVLDPGHNGRNAQNPKIVNKRVPDGRGGTKACNTTGTSSNDGYPEHKLNWDVANRLAKLLRSKGATVVMTRTSDDGVGPCVNQRAKIANDAKADLLLSIHADGAPASNRGFHVIVSTNMSGGPKIEAHSRKLAAEIIRAFPKTGMPLSNYIGKGTALSLRPDMAGLNWSNVPAVMLEAGNMRNTTDARLFSDPRFRQKEAAALLVAVEQFLN